MTDDKTLTELPEKNKRWVGPLVEFRHRVRSLEIAPELKGCVMQYRTRNVRLSSDVGSDSLELYLEASEWSEWKDIEVCND